MYESRRNRRNNRDDSNLKRRRLSLSASNELPSLDDLSTNGGLRYTKGRLRRNINGGNKKNNNSVRTEHQSVFDRDNDSRRKKDNKPESKVESNYKTLSDFVNNFLSNKRNPNKLIDDMDMFCDIAEIMSHYYDDKYRNNNKMVDVMNKMIDIGTSKLFCSSLNIAINRGVVELSEYPIFYLKKFINLVLITSKDKMTAETINMYVDMVVEKIDDISVTLLMDEYGMSDDLAEDLVIGIPFIGNSDPILVSDINRYAPEFIRCLLGNIDSSKLTMNSDMQEKLFVNIFRDDDSILKAIGVCLSDFRLQVDSGNEEAVYDEYIKMLYLLLNDYDIPDIKTVIKYIAKILSIDETKDVESILFDKEVVLDYENISKALAGLADNPTVSKIFLI